MNSRDMLRVRDYSFEWGKRTYIMGVLNITPDSFSGDGLGDNLDQIAAQAAAFEQAGADILDIGGESTNPYNSAPVDEATELARVVPAVQAVRAVTNLPISIDSYKPAVVEAALAAGADIINDIHGLEDPAMQAVAVRTNAPVIAMHMRGTPQTMLTLTNYEPDVVTYLVDFFQQRVAELTAAGIAPDKIILDPGIGFAKDGAQNLTIIARLRELAALGYPLLLGVSRKGFIGRLVAGGLDQPPVPPADRIFGTAAAVTLCIHNGADIVRVHDVAAMRDVARVADAVKSVKV